MMTMIVLAMKDDDEVLNFLYVDLYTCIHVFDIITFYFISFFLCIIIKGWAMMMNSFSIFRATRFLFAVAIEMYDYWKATANNQKLYFDFNGFWLQFFY